MRYFCQNQCRCKPRTYLGLPGGCLLVQDPLHFKSALAVQEQALCCSKCFLLYPAVAPHWLLLCKNGFKSEIKRAIRSSWDFYSLHGLSAKLHIIWHIF